MVNFQSKVVVVAGNKMEYGHFLSEMKLSLRDPKPFMYVGSEFEGIHKLRGYRELEFICVGSWKSRKDIDEVFQLIEMCNIGTRLHGRARVYRLLYL